MTLQLELTPQQEARLNAAAKRSALPPEEVLKKLVDEHLPAVEATAEPQDPTLALFAQWEQEDQNMTPDEIAAENRLWEEFKTNINAERDRVGARRVF